MDYKQFRTLLTAKGCIIRGGEKSMTLFSPQMRLELNLRDGAYTVYNYNVDETMPASYDLGSAAAMILSGVEMFDLYSWYKADWRVHAKGNSLYNIGQLIDRNEDEPGDITLALSICDEMNYLIFLSDYIPDEIKPRLSKDVAQVKEEFNRIINQKK
jgi:hypothetical protein